MQIVSKNISISPLQNVHEFFELGESFDNCLYANSYYKKNSLVLAAKIDEKPTELIELDVNKLRVIQCYGPKNGITKYNKKILSVLNKNLKIFKNHEK